MDGKAKDTLCFFWFIKRLENHTVMCSDQTAQFISFHSEVLEFFAKCSMLNVQFLAYCGFQFLNEILKMKIEYAQYYFRVLSLAFSKFF